MAVPTWEETDDWIPWVFDCLEGYSLKAKVGLRGLTYGVREKDFNLQPDMVEDIWGEKWIFEGRRWYKPAGKEKGSRKPVAKPEVRAPVVAALVAAAVDDRQKPVDKVAALNNI